jgi:hypothetical protein
VHLFATKCPPFQFYNSQALIGHILTVGRTNIGDSILHAGVGGPAGSVPAVVHGEPDLEEVEGVEQHGGGHAPAHTRHQVLYPEPKSKYITNHFTSVGDPWHFGADPDPHFWLMDPDPDPNPAIFVSDLQDVNKIFSFQVLFAYYFLRYILHHFSKIKSLQKSSHKTVEINVFLSFFAWW